LVRIGKCPFHSHGNNENLLGKIEGPYQGLVSFCGVLYNIQYIAKVDNMRGDDLLLWLVIRIPPLGSNASSSQKSNVGPMTASIVEDVCGLGY